MADSLDPHDLAAIEQLAASGLWEQAGLVEAHRLLEMLKRQQRPQRTTLPKSLSTLSQLPEIERELIEDILTLFDDNDLSQKPTLSLLGQVSVLIELVKQRQDQRNSQ